MNTQPYSPLSLFLKSCNSPVYTQHTHFESACEELGGGLLHEHCCERQPCRKLSVHNVTPRHQRLQV